MTPGEGNGQGSVPSQSPMIELRDLRKSFGHLEVLKGISLSLYPGEVMALVGVSGSGKSTLLRCVNLLEMPTAETSSSRALPSSYERRTAAFFSRGAAHAVWRGGSGMSSRSSIWPYRTVPQERHDGHHAPLRRFRQGRVGEHCRAFLGARLGLIDKRNEKLLPRASPGAAAARVAIRALSCHEAEDDCCSTRRPRPSTPSSWGRSSPDGEPFAAEG